jgi:RimJ/RimL family protein N-acetyltransferase
MRNDCVTRFAFTSPLRDDAYVTACLNRGEARLRPLRHGELAPQQAVFDGLSEASRTDRFLTGVDRLTPAMWGALTDVDGHDHVAWLATVDGRPAGLARFVRVAPCTAEVAFEVADEHQGLGLGTVLLDTVTTVAAALRIRRLQASVLGTNLASQHLLAGIGLLLHPSDGILEGESLFHLIDRPRVDRPAVLRLAFAAQQPGGTLSGAA